MRSVIAEPLHARVNLNCRAAGQPRVEVRWTKNGIPVEDLNTNTANLIKVGGLDGQTIKGCLSEYTKFRNVKCIFVIILTVLKAPAYLGLRNQNIIQS